MQTECILAPQRQKVEIAVKEKQILKTLLTQEQIEDVQSGTLVTMLSTGQKVNLDDEVNGTVLMLTPLCGG
jgi:hypothetical protein